MQTETDVCPANHQGIFLGLEPARAQMDPTRRQPGEPPFELGAALPVAGYENDELREPLAPPQCRPPPANAFLQPNDGVDDHVEVFVFGPARWTDDEPGRSADNAH